MRAALLALLLLPGAAMAQGSGVIDELRRQQARPDVPPAVGAQRQAALDADALVASGAAEMLRAARVSLRAGRAGQANELIERAEARLLTRTTLASRADEAVRRGPAPRLAAARAAILRGDRDAATRELDAALLMLDRARR